MSEIVIHIGHGKTGTSAIQSFLALNQATLNECGIIYPDNGSLADAAKSRISSGNGDIALQYNYICNPANKKLLFSSENLFWEVNEDTIKNLKLRCENVKVILWSRDLIEFSYSEWGQQVKRHGSTISFTDFFVKYDPQHHSRVLWWLQTMKNLDVEVVFRNYSKCVNNIIDAFCVDLSLQTSKITDFLPTTQQVVNRSLTHTEYEIQRLANKITGDNSSHSYLSDALCNLCPSVKSGTPVISEEQYNIFYELHSPLLNEINQMVNIAESLSIGSSSQLTQGSFSQEFLSGEQMKIIAEGLIKACGKHHVSENRSRSNSNFLSKIYSKIHRR